MFPAYISQEPSKLNINRPVFFSFFSNERTSLPKATVKVIKQVGENPNVLSQKV